MNTQKKLRPFSGLRADARLSLLGRHDICVQAMLITVLSTALLRVLTILPDFSSAALQIALTLFIRFLLLTFLFLLNIGLSSIYLKCEFNQKPKVSDLFCCFTGGSDSAVIVSGFFALVLTLCLAPAAIAPALLSAKTPHLIWITAGLYAAGALLSLIILLPRSMAPFLLLDFSSALSAREILKKSRSLVRGSTLRLLGLHLSFLPLHLLGLLSLGVAELWIAGYLGVTLAAFYRDLLRIHKKDPEPAQEPDNKPAEQL